MYLSDDTKVLPFSCGLFPKSIQKPEEPKWVIGKTHTISRTREPTRKSDLFPLVAGFPNALGKPPVSRKPLKTPILQTPSRRELPNGNFASFG